MRRLVASQLGASLFDDRLCDLCVGWLLDDVSAIREAATRNLRVLAEQFGTEWAWRVAMPRVLLMRTQRSYLRRITAMRCICSLAETVDASDVAQVVAPALEMCDDRVPNVRFNAALCLEQLAKTVHAAHLVRPTDAAIKSALDSIAPRLLRLADGDQDTDVRDFATKSHANLAALLA